MKRENISEDWWQCLVFLSVSLTECEARLLVKMSIGEIFLLIEWFIVDSFQSNARLHLGEYSCFPDEMYLKCSWQIQDTFSMGVRTCIRLSSKSETSMSSWGSILTTPSLRSSRADLSFSTLECNFWKRTSIRERWIRCRRVLLWSLRCSCEVHWYLGWNNCKFAIGYGMPLDDWRCFEYLDWTHLRHSKQEKQNSPSLSYFSSPETWMIIWTGKKRSCKK